MSNPAFFKDIFRRASKYVNRDFLIIFLTGPSNV